MVIAGISVTACAWLGPLPSLAATRFSAHMIMHMMIVAGAAPLIAIGAAGARLDPVRHAPALCTPLLASLIEFLVIWAWHAPILHHAARASAGMFALEQASFLGAGLLLWFSAFGGTPGERRRRAPAGIAGLLWTSMHMTLLGVLLALADRPLYGQDAMSITDQQAGGVIMLAAGGLIYLLGGLYLLSTLLRENRAGATAGGEDSGAV